MLLPLVARLRRLGAFTEPTRLTRPPLAHLEEHAVDERDGADVEQALELIVPGGRLLCPRVCGEAEGVDAVLVAEGDARRRQSMVTQCRISSPSASRFPL
jgi:hypothetical protein